MGKIKRVSTIFRILFQVFFIFTASVQIIGWIKAPIPLKTFMMLFNVIPFEYLKWVPASLSLSSKCLGFLITLVPTAATLFMSYFLIKLFKSYEMGEIFSYQNACYLKRTGYALLTFKITDLLSQFLLGFVLIPKQNGHHIIIVAMNGSDFCMIVIAFLIILISWIMTEGYNLREEQRLTV